MLPEPVYWMLSWAVLIFFGLLIWLEVKRSEEVTRENCKKVYDHVQAFLEKYWETEGVAKRFFVDEFGKIGDRDGKVLASLGGVEEWIKLNKEFLEVFGLDQPARPGQVTLPGPPAELRAVKEVSDNTLERVREALLEKGGHPDQVEADVEAVRRSIAASYLP